MFNNGSGLLCLIHETTLPMICTVHWPAALSGSSGLQIQNPILVQWDFLTTGIHHQLD